MPVPDCLTIRAGGGPCDNFLAAEDCESAAPEIVPDGP